MSTTQLADVIRDRFMSAVKKMDSGGTSMYEMAINVLADTQGTIGLLEELIAMTSKDIGKKLKSELEVSLLCKDVDTTRNRENKTHRGRKRKANEDNTDHEDKKKNNEVIELNELNEMAELSGDWSDCNKEPALKRRKLNNNYNIDNFNNNNNENKHLKLDKFDDIGDCSDALHLNENENENEVESEKKGLKTSKTKTKTKISNETKSLMKRNDRVRNELNVRKVKNKKKMEFDVSEMCFLCKDYESPYLKRKDEKQHWKGWLGDDFQYWYHLECSRNELKEKMPRMRKHDKFVWMFCNENGSGIGSDCSENELNELSDANDEPEEMPRKNDEFICMFCNKNENENECEWNDDEMNELSDDNDNELEEDFDLDEIRKEIEKEVEQRILKNMKKKEKEKERKKRMENLRRRIRSRLRDDSEYESEGNYESENENESELLKGKKVVIQGDVSIVNIRDSRRSNCTSLHGNNNIAHSRSVGNQSKSGNRMNESDIR